MKAIEPKLWHKMQSGIIEGEEVPGNLNWGLTVKIKI
jgi:hypothetical protein